MQYTESHAKQKVTKATALEPQTSRTKNISILKR